MKAKNKAELKKRLVVYLKKHGFLDTEISDYCTDLWMGLLVREIDKAVKKESDAWKRSEAEWLANMNKSDVDLIEKVRKGKL